MDKTIIKKKTETNSNVATQTKKKTETESFKLNTDLKITRFGRSKRYIVV